MAPTAIAASDTLALWEQADGLSPMRRALALAAYDGRSAEALAGQPVGLCHARLLELRSATIAGPLEAVAVCPGCQARVEFALDPVGLLALHEAAQSIGQPVPPPVVAWRSPTLEDLAGLARERDQVAALARRCVTVGDGSDAAALPRDVLDAVEEAMMAADPLAEVLVALACPECGDGFDCSIDLADFVWAELDARARRLLNEVAVLARAYGWTEPEVLALSEPRRAAYLRLVLEGAP